MSLQVLKNAVTSFVMSFSHLYTIIHNDTEGKQAQLLVKSRHIGKSHLYDGVVSDLLP
jgi:hypothetical protein